MLAANTSFHINQPSVDAQKPHVSLAPFVPNCPPLSQEKTIFSTIYLGTHKLRVFAEIKFYDFLIVAG